jgi:CBS domain containing-hemolysin-like protein
LTLVFKSKSDDGITEEELISIIEEAEEEGDINEDEGTLIKSAIEFNDLEVSDIFTPRIEITAVSAQMTKDEISVVFSESGYSRLPVYDGDIDNVIGILYYKDFFNIAFKYDVEISSILKPVIYVAKTQKINDLLKELQRKQKHLAIVLDEFGSTAGLITLEDILEEIVGDIWDEHDEKVEEFVKSGDKEYTVLGMMSISKLFDLFDIDDDGELEASNVNGWAMEVLGKMPEQGDTFEALGLSVEILESNGKRVESARVTDVRPEEEEEESTLKKWFSSDEKDEKDEKADAEESKETVSEAEAQ